jgi:hypothetical protein
MDRNSANMAVDVRGSGIYFPSQGGHIAMNIDSYILEPGHASDTRYRLAVCVSFLKLSKKNAVDMRWQTLISFCPSHNFSHALPLSYCLEKRREQVNLPLKDGRLHSINRARKKCYSYADFWTNDDPLYPFPRIDRTPSE